MLTTARCTLLWRPCHEGDIVDHFACERVLTGGCLGDAVLYGPELAASLGFTR
jgi:hypothetical protein